jgi:hypothetical protein
VQAQRHPDDLAHALARVERRERILEDHLHLAPQRLHLLPPRPSDVLPAKAERAVGRVDQAHDRPRHRRLAAAGLPHQPERLALVDR